MPNSSSDTPSSSAPTATGPKPAAASHPRLLSLDALRGFDMFWIVGAEEIVHAMHKVNHSSAVNLLTNQLTHKDWVGVGFYDLIFPLFVFIVGVSLVFSLTRILETHGRATAYRRVITRGAILYVIGLFYYGGFTEGFDHIRLMGVLQRIGLCYLFTGLLFCTFRLKGLIVACASLLIGYCLLMTLVPVPGYGAGVFVEGQNLANYIDKGYLPFFKWDGDHDPEGLLSTLPAIGTCLLGVFTGLFLRNSPLSQQKKAAFLFGAGVCSVLLGFLWGLQFPIIKKIWTSSYVLVAGGYSCIFLAVFYQVIEIWGFRKWATPFVWIGLNPLTIYLIHNMVDLKMLANRLVGGPIKAGFGDYADVLVMTVITAMSFAVVHFLYRRKIFLRL